MNEDKIREAFEKSYLMGNNGWQRHAEYDAKKDEYVRTRAGSERVAESADLLYQGFKTGYKASMQSAQSEIERANTMYGRKFQELEKVTMERDDAIELIRRFIPVIPVENRTYELACDIDTFLQSITAESGEKTCKNCYHGKDGEKNSAFCMDCTESSEWKQAESWEIDK